MATNLHIPAEVSTTSIFVTQPMTSEGLTHSKQLQISHIHKVQTTTTGGHTSGMGDTATAHRGGRGATAHRSCPYRHVKRMPRCAHFSPLLCPVLSALRFSCSSTVRVGSSPSLPLAACWSEESLLVSPTAESFGGRESEK